MKNTTTTENITLEQVRALSRGAAEAGDLEMVETCELAELALYDAARGADAAPHDSHAPALEAVVAAIQDAEAQDDGEPRDDEVAL